MVEIATKNYLDNGMHFLLMRLKLTQPVLGNLTTKNNSIIRIIKN